MRIATELHKRIGFLAGIDFLTKAPRTLLERIARDVEKIDVALGTVIFDDEGPGDAMYFIVDGEIRIEKRRQYLLSRRAGEYIGEMALVDDSPRSAAAVAATGAVLLRWNRSSFRSTLIQDGEVAFQVCRALSSKIRESAESISRFKMELERAVQVQRAMLPERTFCNETLDLEARCIQTDKVGGDYYDYIPFENNQVALIVADAQGHGFPAALLVAMLKTRLHSFVAQNRQPSKVMKALNHSFTNNLHDIQTATCCYVLADRKTRKLQICGAGHIPQFLYRSDTCTVDLLRSENILLGFDGQLENFKTTTRIWRPGDLLFLCTDGVTETRNQEEEEFGAHRVQDLLAHCEAWDPERIQSELFEKLKTFRGDDKFEDDVTVLVARLL